MRHFWRFVAAAALLVFICGSSSGLDGNELAAISVPSDVHELATERITTPATPKEISAAFSLVDLARRNVGSTKIQSLAFTMKVSFTASGAVSYIGSGNMEEMRIASGTERRSVTLGNSQFCGYFKIVSPTTKRQGRYRSESKCYVRHFSGPSVLRSREIV